MAPRERDIFHDKLDDIQKQVDQMGEQVSSALDSAQNAQTAIDIIASRVSTLEEENKTHSNARDMPDSEGFWRDMPDSEGFWRDIDDDIWARDDAGNVKLIARGHQTDNDHREIYDLSYNYGTQGSGPFTKIDNPFIEREDHAD